MQLHYLQPAWGASIWGPHQKSPRCTTIHTCPWDTSTNTGTWAHTCTRSNEAFPHPTAMQASFCSYAILHIPRRTYRHTHLDPVQQCNIPHLCPASVHTHSCPPAATPLPALHAPAPHAAPRSLACTQAHCPQPHPHIPHRAAEGHCPATRSASSCLVQDTQGSKTHH